MGSSPTRRAVFAPLGVPQYRRLLGAVLASNTALLAHHVTAAWLVFTQTRSTFAVGLVTAALWVPQVVLALPAGAFADRFDRRQLLVASITLRGVVAFAMAGAQAAGWLTTSWLLVGTGLTGVGMAVTVPAYNAVLPHLVPRPLLPGAISLHSGMANLARAIGPAVGGVLVGIGRADVAFALDGITYVLVIVVIVSLRGLPARPSTSPPLGISVREGIRQLQHSEVLRWAIGIAGLFVFGSASLQVILPLMADTALDVGASGYGALSAAFGAGAVVGSLVLQPMRQRTTGPLLRWALLLTVGGYVMVWRSPNLVLSLLGLFAIGMAWIWVVATAHTAVQIEVDDAFRGRVSSLLQLATTSMHPVGGLVAGMLADELGGVPALGVLTLGVALLAMAAHHPAAHVVTDRVQAAAAAGDHAVPASQGEDDVIIETLS